MIRFQGAPACCPPPADPCADGGVPNTLLSTDPANGAVNVVINTVTFNFALPAWLSPSVDNPTGIIYESIAGEGDCATLPALTDLQGLVQVGQGTLQLVSTHAKLADNTRFRVRIRVANGCGLAQEFSICFTTGSPG